MFELSALKTDISPYTFRYEYSLEGAETFRYAKEIQRVISLCAPVCAERARAHVLSIKYEFITDRQKYSTACFDIPCVFACQDAPISNAFASRDFK